MSDPERKFHFAVLDSATESYKQACKGKTSFDLTTNTTKVDCTGCRRTKAYKAAVEEMKQRLH